MDKTDMVRKQIGQLGEAMHENLDLAAQRGGNLDDLSDHSHQIQADSRTFKHRSTMARRRSCREYYRTMFIIGLVIAAVVGLILLIVFLK